MKRSFKLLKLIAIVSERFIPPGGYPGLMEVCKFLIGRTNEASIDIPPILNATKIEILKQHPWIGELPIPNFKKVEQIEPWYKKLLKKHPEMVEFTLPKKMISKEEIFKQTMTGLRKATGIPQKELRSATRKAKKALGV